MSMFQPRDINHITCSDTFEFGLTALDDVLRNVQQHSNFGHQISFAFMSASSTVDIAVQLNGGGSWGQSARAKYALLWVASANNLSPSNGYRGCLTMVKMGDSIATSAGRLSSFYAGPYGYQFFSQIRAASTLTRPVYGIGGAAIKLNEARFDRDEAGVGAFVLRFENTTGASAFLVYSITGWVWS